MKPLKTHLIWLVLGLAAVVFAAPIAQANSNSGEVGLARGILETQFGFSPSRAADWTTGVCSYQVKPSSCYQTPAHAQAQSVAEAPALGVFRGMSPQQIQEWSVGVCSYQDKPSSCYLTPKHAAAQSQAEAVAIGATRTASPPAGLPADTSVPFSWSDAGIGAAATLGFILFLSGLGAALLRNQRRQPTHA
jgi:hypothetical protein